MIYGDVLAFLVINILESINSLDNFVTVTGLLHRPEVSAGNNAQQSWNSQRRDPTSLALLSPTLAWKKVGRNSTEFCGSFALG